MQKIQPPEWELQVLFMIAAHNKMASRNETVMAILREMVAAEGSGMSCMRLDMGLASLGEVLKFSRSPRDKTAIILSTALVSKIIQVPTVKPPD